MTLSEPEQMLQAKESLQRLKRLIEGMTGNVKKEYATRYSRELAEYVRKFGHLKPKTEEELIHELFG